MTAIACAAFDNRIKGCIVMDPWFFPYKDDYSTLVTRKTPILALISETWFQRNKETYNFDCYLPTSNFFTQCTALGNQNSTYTIIKGCTHAS